MADEELLTDLEKEWTRNRRRFAAGVFLSMIRLVRDLRIPESPLDGLDDFFRRFPPSDVTASGGRANTLFVRQPHGDLVSLRPYYNAVEHFIRNEQRRFDYPSCAPHATQSWGDYRRWLDAFVRMDPERLARVERAAEQFVLERLTIHEAPEAPPQPRRFTRVLEEFDLAARKGEATGAAYQGVIYAYIRADMPHLHLDVASVRTGSKRIGRVGDIDGWQGEFLVFSAEVKHFVFRDEDVADVEGFANEVARRGAMGLLAAEDFAGNARAQVEALGLRTLSRLDLLRLIDFWDPLKQESALSAFIYYVHHVERKHPLIERLGDFIKETEEDAGERK